MTAKRTPCESCGKPSTTADGIVGAHLCDEYACLLAAYDRAAVEETDIQPAAPAKPHRQPAYNAVFALIKAIPPRSTDDYNRACENARVWRAVQVALDAMDAAGLLLPPDTETVEQHGVRVYRDGQLMDESDPPVSRERAQQRVDWHARERQQNPDWPGLAVLVRRHQHTTPWTPVEETQ